MGDGEKIEQCSDTDVIDTTVHGNVQEAHDFARWLKGLASNLSKLATGVQRSLSVSASWIGDASDAYYDYAEKIGRQIMSLDNNAADLWPSLDEWADDKATVKSRMEQARTWAQEKGMTVSGTLIFPPPTPPEEPQLPDNPSSQDYSNYEKAGIESRKAWDAWYEFRNIKNAVNDYRGMERAADEKLAETLGDTQANINGMITVTGKAATTYLSLAGNVGEVSKKLAGFANETRDDLMEAMKTMKAGGSVNVASFQKAYNEAVAEKQAHERGLGRIPGQEVASWRITGNKNIPFLRKLPVLGTIGGMGLAGVSILDGQSPGETVTRYATSTGAAVLADDAATWLIPGGRIAKPAIRVAAAYGAGDVGDYLAKEAYEKATKEVNDDYNHLKVEDK